jgi:hypothetical protein
MLRRNAFLALTLLALAPSARAEEAPPSGMSDEVARRFRLLEEQLTILNNKVKHFEDEAAKSAPVTHPYSEPYSWGDFTWLNGNNRNTESLLDSKYFTPQLDLDTSYTYSFNDPIDHTLVGSTATFRHNELALNYVGVGGDLHIGNVRGRLYLQLGERAVGVPRNDVTPNRGQYDLETAMRYLAEAYVGYHINKLHGINIDLGEFFSYVGLFSYMQFENWGYQASFTSDNTPWFFVGNRTQIFPTDRLKVELWIVNGWQTYGKFNELPGFGFQIDYRPREWAKLILSAYLGWDTQDASGRTRYHTDDSLLIRYYNKPESKGLSRIASSLTFDLGGEEGAGVTSWRGANTPGNCTDSHPCEQDFLSGMLYFNFWFYQNNFSLLLGGGFMRNPGRYLVLTPTGLAGPGSPNGFSTAAGTTFFGWDTSQNISWYPSNWLTIRFENSFHHSDDPYYAGHGGVTAPDGYKCGGLYDADARIYTCAPPGWKPDLVKNEDKIMFIALFRL